MKNGKHLVTGATGLVGSHIAEQLTAQGTRVVALVRPASDVAHLEALGVELVQGDVRRPADLARACRGVEVVHHAAAKLGEWEPRSEFVELNVNAVEALMEAAWRAGVRRVVHVSSVAVYGRERRAGIEEATPYRPTGNAYMDTKALGEAVARTASSRTGIELSIVRPCFVYGPRDRSFLPHVCRNLERGRAMIIGSGEHRANTVFAGTVAELCAVLADHPGAAGEAFNVADPDPLTWRELYTAVALRIGAPPPHLSVPLPLAWTVGGAMEIAARAIGSPKPPPLTRFVVGALGYDLSYATRKAAERLGFHPRTSVRDGLERALAARGFASHGLAASSRPEPVAVGRV